MIPSSTDVTSMVPPVITSPSLPTMPLLELPVTLSEPVPPIVRSAVE